MYISHCVTCCIYGMLSRELLILQLLCWGILYINPNKQRKDKTLPSFT